MRKALKRKRTNILNTMTSMRDIAGDYSSQDLRDDYKQKKEQIVKVLSTTQRGWVIWFPYNCC